MIKAYHTKKDGRDAIGVECGGTSMELKSEMDCILEGALEQFITQAPSEAEEGLTMMMMLGMLQRHMDTVRGELDRLSREAEEEGVRNGIVQAMKMVDELGNDPEKIKEKTIEMCEGFLKSIDGLEEKSRVEEMEEEMARKILGDEK